MVEIALNMQIVLGSMDILQVLFFLIQKYCVSFQLFMTFWFIWSISYRFSSTIQMLVCLMLFQRFLKLFAFKKFFIIFFSLACVISTTRFYSLLICSFVSSNHCSFFLLYFFNFSYHILQFRLVLSCIFCLWKISLWFSIFPQWTSLWPLLWILYQVIY